MSFDEIHCVSPYKKYCRESHQFMSYITEYFMSCRITIHSFVMLRFIPPWLSLLSLQQYTQQTHIGIHT
ncbi:hypothetical protein DERF_004259 [Dermatophagoides farinae]|uniref:Uncharacterized protein n=1 Tax=Dermatophagoides farinae TaxID=6954 RepID=A0A922L4Y5_DERFA|nr:hypothetical protein DERF_004259 [Dermatophagoides farinae]